MSTRIIHTHSMYIARVHNTRGCHENLIFYSHFVSCLIRFLCVTSSFSSSLPRVSIRCVARGVRRTDGSLPQSRQPFIALVYPAHDLAAFHGRTTMANVADSGSSVAKKQGAIKIAGQTVALFNDAHFKKVRESYKIDDNAIVKSGSDCTGKEEFDFAWLAPSGGKGGDLMGFTKVFGKDRKTSRTGGFIIKEMKGDDHKSMIDFHEEYCKHIAAGDSFISAFFFHFRHEEMNQNFIVMNNCMPGRGMEDMYDLKGGTADDKTQRLKGKKIVEVHKRCWSPMNCGLNITPERTDYLQGKRHAKTVKFHVTKQNREIIVKTIKKDTDFLKSCNLMDYSLLVGVKRDPDLFCKGVTETQPFIGEYKDAGPEAYYIGIVDFLQGWNCKKDMAHYIKLCAPKPLSTVKPSIYGTRFYHHFKAHFVGDAGFLAKTSFYEPSTKTAADGTSANQVNVETR